MSGLRSRRKGAAFEREMAKRFREVLPEAKRGLQMQSGAEAPDVDAAPFWCECKVGASPRMEAALEQAERDAPNGRIPIAVTKRDYRQPILGIRLGELISLAYSCGENPPEEDPIVSLRLDDFLELIDGVEW